MSHFSPEISRVALPCRPKKTPHSGVKLMDAHKLMKTCERVNYSETILCCHPQNKPPLTAVFSWVKAGWAAVWQAV
nr:MAG TPA: hypothetical protein [Caudoviricetes sp.]